MFIAAFFITAKLGSNQNVLQKVKNKLNGIHPDKRIFSAKKKAY